MNLIALLARLVITWQSARPVGPHDDVGLGRLYSVVATDLDGTILLWNSGAQLRYGYTSAEAVGRTKHILHIPADVAAGKPEAMMAAALRLGTWEDTVTRIRKDGTTFPARLVLTTRHDREGEPVGFLLISKDISEEQAALLRLEEASRMVSTSATASSAAWNEGVVRSRRLIWSSSASAPRSVR